MSQELKPCPFCGGDAESDAKQSFRAFVSGHIEDAVAVYCRDCGAQISICVPDVPDITIEQVVGMWNASAESSELTAALWKAREALQTFVNWAFDETIPTREAVEPAKEALAAINAINAAPGREGGKE